MPGNALLEVIDPDEAPVQLLYLPPLGDFRAYEARLSSLAGRYCERICFRRVRASELFRFTSAQVFLSRTVPNILLIRCRDLIGHAVGELPLSELKALLGNATRRTA